MVAQRKELQQNQALSTSSQEHSTRTPHSSILSPDPALFFNPYIQGCRLHVWHLELASVSNHGHRDLQGTFGSEPDPTLKALGLRSLRACRPAKVLAFEHSSLHRVTLKVLERGSLRASYRNLPDLPCPVSCRTLSIITTVSRFYVLPLFRVSLPGLPPTLNFRTRPVTLTRDI